ncbi:aldo/keto reductase [Piscinibacter gummiphilus]|uniref:Aldo/keto reductase n=1 Tax=Piscinibacter gummiphilus TaxID=946333 RepID=A0ABZ0CRE4_9BURK|nr:aldo/keto reductase [Piscinibacter gummiphilus]WOB07549.1 aldo/keto reductase [Piscinibacter gummiphilus]
MCMNKHITLPSGERVAALGQGTWNIGDDPKRRADEIASLRRGLDLGLTLIDTAEMYGDGRSEQLIGEAIRGRRDEVFLVSKVYPHNASKRAMPTSCEASLKRLGTDRIDLYLLHWPGSVPLAETVQAFEALQRDGKIRHWGVSNFDTKKMASLHALAGGAAVQTNQVLYHLGERGIEWELAPWQREHHIPVMAYSPTDQGRLLHDEGLAAFALRTGRTPAQVALAWLLARDAIVIPKTRHPARVQENAGALDKPLTADELHELDALFPPPDGPSALAML